MSNSFDIFISYSWNIKDQVEKLDNKLNSAGFSTWRDDTKMCFNESLHTQLAEGILNSKLVLVCLTKEYIKSENCKKEINYASNLKKPMSILMIDHMTPQDMGGIGLLISMLLRVNCYKNPNDWLDVNFEEIVKSIMDNINKKSKQLAPAVKQTSEPSIDCYFPNLKPIKKVSKETGDYKFTAE